MVAGKFREDAQFDLRIVSDDEPPRCGIAHEAASILSRVWHLLNVWIGAGEASRRRANLSEVSVQPARLWIDEPDHVLAIARQRLLHCAVLEQLLNDRILRGQRLQLPVASRIRQRNSKSRQCFSHLLLRIKIDVRARRPEQRRLRYALAQHLLQLIRDFAALLFDDRKLLQPSRLVHIESREFEIDYRHDAFEFKLRTLN